jgi:predicted CopG family antitoxin
MLKQMTISVEEDVYHSLEPIIALHSLDDYISNLVRSRNAEPTLEEAYIAMAADTEREQEAQEWCNAAFGPIGVPQ